MISNFEKIIEDLLHKFECVILPDFGGFIVRESPCNFSASGDRIKPYSKHIFFNPHLTLNDGLVYNEIQTQKGCTYTEAVQFYNDSVHSYKKLISEAGSAHFGALGTFFQGKENNYWFSPSSDLNLSQKSFGLYPVDIKKVLVQSENLAKENSKIVELKTETIADNKALESTGPVKLNYKAWVAAAIVALLVHFTYLKLETNDVSTNEASVLPTFPTHVDHPIQSEKDITNISTDSSYSEAQIDTSAEVLTAPSVENPTAIIPEQSSQLTIEPAIAEESKATIEKPSENHQSVSEKTEVVPSEPIQSDTEVSNQNESDTYTKVAKYRMENNAIFHKKDLEKKGNIVKIEEHDGLYEVYIKQ